MQITLNVELYKSKTKQVKTSKNKKNIKLYVLRIIMYGNRV